MNKVFISADNIITSLGFTTSENIKNILDNNSGVRLNSDPKYSKNPFFASVVDDMLLTVHFTGILNQYHPGKKPEDFTRLEQLLLISAHDALSRSSVPAGDKSTLFILSTTKGNIDLLGDTKRQLKNPNKLFLWDTARFLSSSFNNPNQPIVVSNACISGLLAIIYAARLIQLGKYENVIVCGSDIMTEFVASGFQSFQSLENGVCKPFDEKRNGLSLGEGCATIILSSNESYASSPKVEFIAGGSANDANHISGPSRTAEGLYLAIQSALSESGLTTDQIGFISAHGTATPFNDEMEAQGIFRANLSHVPVNSFKGYFGHTLGAAGIIESILTIHSLKTGTLFKTFGFETLGVSEKLNVISEHSSSNINYAMKLASGFGGCNATAIFAKK
jgi:3-oxoacyl-[acyl-carrier-protein] synthase I